ncbi:MAG: methylenetetrahydrofolate--tRNA-(uracil(54)-C(5))-methyltransferase (FADH(2)-oxidizing) TrmFO [Peptococcaceae bacterium]|nr:methylenetetrahydrofolate--tRNA-(uracil(54)-C(5))-methyltransferase (FADH(2)-oxidizing) TrmFO [Peptococcaceae bacterium]
MKREEHNEVIVIGAGLAGAEAAWQLARRGVGVRLYEMRPHKMTPAHTSAHFAELVCSNSLRANMLENAVGLLKEEMRRLDSLIMAVADEVSVPAGGALAVDRNLFAKEVTRRVEELPEVTVLRKEVTALPILCEEVTALPVFREEDADLPGMTEIIIVATGPLTSDALAESIRQATGEEALAFYDAAAPIVTAESVDMETAYWASRYDKGGADYLNCPMDEDQYKQFREAVLAAETHEVHGFEQGQVFEACVPIEILAARGAETMAYGPLKPVGLRDPRSGRVPFAVVQLRKENIAGTLLNLVGFQTHLKWGEQKRVFRMIPGLERAEFVRYGVMHRNTFLNAPKVLDGDFSWRAQPRVFFAGQITGVEGYVESAASGLVAGINAWRRLRGQATLVFPANTALGGLARHLAGSPTQDFQPMNVNFGLLPPLERRVKSKREKNLQIAQRALGELADFCQETGIGAQRTGTGENL